MHPLPDAALLALARQFHTALGCDWLALTAAPGQAPAGPRLLIELPGTIRATPADQFPRLLPLSGRLLPPNLLPADCQACLPWALRGPAGLVGLLELAWRNPPPVPNPEPPADLLTLAALLADD